MASRFIPNSYPTLFEYISKMDQKMAGVAPADRPFSVSSWTRYQDNRTIFLNELQEYQNSTSVQKLATDTAIASWTKLYKHVSHYFQVLNLAIERGVFPASVRSFYGLADGKNPTLNTDADLTSWSAKIKTGDAARVAAGGTPMFMPSAAEVETTRTGFNTDQQAQADAKLSNIKEQADVAKVFENMVKAIMDLYAQLEFAYRDESIGYIHNVIREYGMQFINNAGESFMVEYGVPAGTTAVVSGLTLTDSSAITLTAIEGSDAKACSNPAGCPDGLALPNNTPVQTNKAALGGGNNIVLTNTGTANAVVKVEVVG